MIQIIITAALATAGVILGIGFGLILVMLLFIAFAGIGYLISSRDKMCPYWKTCKGYNPISHTCTVTGGDYYLKGDVGRCFESKIVGVKKK